MKKDYYTSTKLFIGVFVTAGIFAVAGLIAYQSLTSLRDSVHSISGPGLKLVKIKKITTSVDKAGRSIENYILGKESRYLKDYETNRKQVYNNILALKKEEITNEQKSNLDSVTILLIERDRIWKEFIVKHHEIVSTEKNKPSGLILYQGRSKENKSKESDLADNKNGEKKFWKLFKRENLSASVIKPEEASQNESVKTIPEADVKQILAKVRQQEKESRLKENNLHREILANNESLTALIKEMLSRIEDEEIALTLTRVHEVTSQTADKTSAIMMYLCITGIFVGILFIGFINRDIVQRKKYAEELVEVNKKTEQLSRIKEEFLSNVSHEIRTPMNVVVGFSNQLARTNVDKKQYEFITGIKRSCDHILRIVNEILDFSKMEAGRLTIETVGFRLKEVASDIYVSLKPQAEKKGISLELSYDSSLPEIIIGDQLRLRQILLNLTGNAIKFTDKGKVEMIFKPAGELNDQMILKVMVKDTGMGIPREKMKSIFEVFSQADISITRKYGGTGLGLSISKKLVEMQNGSISVTSEPGQGSKFIFSIPYKKGTEKDLPLDELTVIEDNPLLKNKNILIVDDDELNQLLSQHILEHWGLSVKTAKNGKEALERILKEDFDLVLMDVQMPEMNGIELTQHIRQNFHNHKALLPVIAVTGNVMPGEEMRCLKAGMNDYISKPFSEQDLYSKLIKCISA